MSEWVGECVRARKCQCVSASVSASTSLCECVRVTSHLQHPVRRSDFDKNVMQVDVITPLNTLNSVSPRPVTTAWRILSVVNSKTACTHTEQADSRQGSQITCDKGWPSSFGRERSTLRLSQKASRLGGHLSKR